MTAPEYTAFSRSKQQTTHRVRLSLAVPVVVDIISRPGKTMAAKDIILTFDTVDGSPWAWRATVRGQTGSNIYSERSASTPQWLQAIVDAEHPDAAASS